MSSQEAVHVSPMEVTPRSGKGTLGTWWFHVHRGGRKQSRHKPTHAMKLSCEQTIRSRGVCEPALEPRVEWEGPRTRCQDFKPDLGNSAVRHYRGASGDVAMVEMRTQLAIERAGLVTLYLQLARRSSIPTIDPGRWCERPITTVTLVRASECSREAATAPISLPPPRFVGGIR